MYCYLTFLKLSLGHSRARCTPAPARQRAVRGTLSAWGTRAAVNDGCAYACLEAVPPLASFRLAGTAGTSMAWWRWLAPGWPWESVTSTGLQYQRGRGQSHFSVPRTTNTTSWAWVTGLRASPTVGSVSSSVGRQMDDSCDTHFTKNIQRMTPKTAAHGKGQLRQFW